MTKSVLIIGGGIAGLSCGCYAAMNGYRTKVLEMHTKPGGVCTAWQRKGYTFDGCIHWLMGSSPDSGMNRLWRELGVTLGRRFVDPPEHRRYEEDGRSLSLFTDLARLRAHLLEVAPEDAPLIHELCRAIDKLGALEMPLDEPWTWSGLTARLRMLPALGSFQRYSRMPISAVSARVKTPFLRRALQALFSLDEAPVSAFLMGLAVQCRKNAGYPLGGSLAFAQAMAQRCASLGGELLYGARVSKILVERGRAVGVRTEDGKELRADHVVSAADGFTTIFKMLDGKFIDDQLRSLYRGGMPTFEPLVQVSLGLRRVLDLPPAVVFPLPRPIAVGANTHRHLTLRNLACDPALAPPGCSTATTTLTTDYESWTTLRGEPERYRAEKQRIGDEVVERLEQKWPGLAKDVEVIDVATPATWERYTGNWRASYEGWMMTTKTMGHVLSGGLPKRLPGLGGFSMIGQWTTVGGGVPPAAKDGRDEIRRLCRMDGRKFVALEA